MWLKTKVSKKRTFWAEKVLVFIIVILLYNNCFIFPLQDFFNVILYILRTLQIYFLVKNANQIT